MPSHPPHRLAARRAAGVHRHGHRFGEGSDELLGYRDARYNIYLPAYRWVLENCLSAEVQQLRDEATRKTVVLLDYETNGDIADLARPLSHAALIKHYLEGKWPTHIS